jgi:uncharacterized protein YyaL (SSP411 family)
VGPRKAASHWPERETPPRDGSTGRNPLRDKVFDPMLIEQGLITILARFDREHGGIGDGPKHPQPAVLELLLRGAVRGIRGAGTAVDVTLEKMARGGIYDQLGGGFHRYAQDRTWMVPRFEKNLCDNALLARAYTHAWQLRQQPLYRRIASEVLEYLVRDLSDPAGGFYTSQAAATEGQEAGEFYLWTHDEFASVAPGSLDYYGITPGGNLRGKNVLTARGDDPPAADRAALMHRRSARSHPDRNENILASWNGLAISAFAEAGAAFRRQDLLEAARRAATFVLQYLKDPSSGRLLHYHKDAHSKVPGTLEDYAYLAEGLFSLWEATFEPQWIESAQQLAGEMLELFWDLDRGGLFSTAMDHDRLGSRTKEYLDGAAPSAAAVASMVLLKLGNLTGHSEYSTRAVEVLQSAELFTQGNPAESAAMLSALDFSASTPMQIVILGSQDDHRTKALLREVWERFIPNRVLAGAPPGLRCAMLEGKEQVNGQPTAFVRRGGVGLPPVTEPQELGRFLTSWKEPSSGQLRHVTSLIGNALQNRRFFDNLQNPSWIRPLQDAGLFDNPPAPVHDYAQGTVGSPPWPQSQYLARMASISPNEVHQVAMDLDEGDNVLIHEDLADAALSMPADLAADFVPKAKEWLKSPYQLHLPEKLGGLVRRLAEGGRPDEALELALSLLELRPGPARGEAMDVMSGPPEPVARFNRFNYEQILRNDIPTLVEKGQLRSLNLISDLLDSAIRYSHQSGQDRPPVDHSHLWRPAIHDHELNVDKTLRDPLVSAAVEAAEQIARSTPSRVPELVEALGSREWHVFKRIAMHLLRVWPEQAGIQISEHLNDRRLFDDPHFHHEYMLLLQEHFTELTAEEQATILSWVEEGPKFDLWASDSELSGGDTQSAQVLERYSKLWKLKRLTILEDVLPPRYRELIDLITAELGYSEHPEFVTYLPPARSDPTTPKQADDLHGMYVEDIVEFLRSWRPSPGLGNPTVDGLARKLAAVVAAEPVRFAASADRFQGLDPSYAWAVLQGLREAAEGYAFEWRGVLELCRWASSAPTEGDARRWAPARLEAARVLSAGFSQGVGQMPFELRSKAWEALRPLTEGPDFTVNSHAKGSRPAAPGTPPTGSTLAEALHAVVRYALWVRRYLETTPNARERTKRGLKEMPEVAKVLDLHLGPKAHATAATQAVYGQWFPWLMLMDSRWTGERIHTIFPEDPSAEDLRDAAWEAYIRVSPPFDQLLQILSREYERAVERTQVPEVPVIGGMSPQQKLAEHLMVFFFRGKLSPGEPNGLLARFFQGASDQLRAYAVSFVGQTLQAQEKELPGSFLGKLASFWEWRFEQARTNEADHQAELAAFGWWFASGKLDDAWALEQLFRVLELGIRIDNPKSVVSQLAALVDTFAEPAVRCLGLVLSKEQDSVNLASLTDDAKTVLNKAIERGDSAARAAAIDLLDFFEVSELEELARGG